MKPSGYGADEVRQSETAELAAIWRPTHDSAQSIEIISVHGRSGNGFEVMFAAGTDLAAARAQRPEWDPLWDKVSAEFWAGIQPVRTAHHDSARHRSTP